MYRILLVDDEAVELDTLKNYIDWKSFGVGQVDAAGNGKAAFELVLERRPDIVITDIQMPVMDGIALARKIYEWDPHIKIVFLTGYDEFSYVKAALGVRAVDYLLKPFSEESIGRVIGNVREEIEKDRLFDSSLDLMRKTLLKRLCAEEQTPRELLLRELERAWPEGGRKAAFGMIRFCHVMPADIARSMEKRLAEIEAAWQDKEALVFLIRSYVDFGDCAQRIRRILKEHTGRDYSAVYLARAAAGGGLRDGFRMLESWDNEMFYQQAGTLWAVERFRSDKKEALAGREGGKEAESAAEIRRSLKACLQNAQEQELETLMERIFGYFRKNRTQKSQLLIFLYDLFRPLEEKYGAENSAGAWPERDPFFEQVRRCGCIQEVRELIEGFAERILAAEGGFGEGNTSAGKRDFVVKKVMEYVQEHYARVVSVEDMAREIHFSANYIRSIFKEGTGQTILEYLTDYRFKKACELLAHSEYKVKEVSLMVGYDNVSYFGSVFTRRFGMTPNEYRRRNM